MTGPELMADSQRRIQGLTQRQDPVTLWCRRTAYALLLGSAILFGTVAGLTWTAFDIALESATIGEVVQKTVIGRTLAYLKVYRTKR